VQWPKAAIIGIRWDGSYRRISGRTRQLSTTAESDPKATSGSAFKARMMKFARSTVLDLRQHYDFVAERTKNLD
jgi:hypothetical protein